MSGGVDSSTTAAILKDEGYQVIGITLHLWCEEKQGSVSRRRSCCAQDDIEDARRVCHVLGIPHYVLNFQQEFQDFVVEYFCQEYLRGRTPNPCLACNEHIKFRLLLDRALALGADHLATGHYARIEQSPDGYELHQAVDASKDQSYVLFTLGQKELRHLLLPLGNCYKSQVRQMASQWRLPVSDKPDSQEICFLPKGDYRPFLAQRFQHTPGDIRDGQGNLLGRHKGIAFYTVGQRQGLGLCSSKPLYVVGIDAPSNTITVGSEAELLSDGLTAAGLRWVSGAVPRSPTALSVKYRYKSQKVGAWMEVEGDVARIRFENPQRAITPGQAIVFYLGDLVLGGGIIEKAERPELGTGTQGKEQHASIAQLC